MRILRTLVTLTVALFTACLTMQPIGAQSVKQVTVTIATSSLALGSRTTASARVRLANGTYTTNKPIAWGTSKPGVALVSTTGVVSTVTPGTASIVATVSGVVGQAVLTVIPGAPLPPPPAAVASVTVSLGATSLIVGQTTTATTVVRDSTGDVLTGRDVLWTSLTPSLATVSPASGLITALATGTATIRAAVEAKTGNAALAVVAAPADTTHPVDTTHVIPPSPGHPNEPVGFTALRPNLAGDVVPTLGNLDSATSLGWMQGATITKATDTLPDIGASSVLQISYCAGCLGGGAPGKTWTYPQTFTQNPRSLYQSYWYKLSPNFPVNLVANKVTYTNLRNLGNTVYVDFGASADYRMGGGDSVIFDPGHATPYTAAIRPGIELQGIQSVAGNTNNAQGFFDFSRQIIRGRWHHIETLYVANTAGVEDGSAKMWIDGQLSVTVNNVKWTAAANVWDWTTWWPVYGGGGQIPVDAINPYHRLKDFYVSGKP